MRNIYFLYTPVEYYIIPVILFISNKEILDEISNQEHMKLYSLSLSKYYHTFQVCEFNIPMT